MISELEYYKAKEIVNKYELQEIEKAKKLELYKPGTKLKILRANGNSLIKIGDIIEVIKVNYYDSVIIVFRNKNGILTSIKENKGWNWIIC